MTDLDRIDSIPDKILSDQECDFFERQSFREKRGLDRDQKLG